MLRHPFFGVIEPGASAGDVASVDGRALAGSDQRATAKGRATGRRTFFAQALAGLFGAGALLVFGPRAEGQTGGGFGQATGPGGRSSFDAGYGGQSKGNFRGGLGGDAFGDPGPRYNGGGGNVTTFAIGEEGGPVTTYALGEEGGRVTTYALGEEGAYYHYYRPYRSYRPRYTTYALGEEGGRW